MGSGSIPGPSAGDWKTRLRALISTQQYEDAFRDALADPAHTLWLVRQLPSPSVLLGGAGAPPLSQPVMVALVKQLSVDIERDAGTKLTWMREAAMAINNKDPSIAAHLQSVLGPVLTAVQALANAPGGVPGVGASEVKLTMHVIHSVLH